MKEVFFLLERPCLKKKKNLRDVPERAKEGESHTQHS